MTFKPIERPDGHPLVELDVAEGVAQLTLVDTRRRNALRIELSLDLEAAVHEALAADVGAIVLTAAPPVFCSGGDLDDLLGPRASLTDIGRGARALTDAPVVTIAAVNGPVIGAGINLALACDVLLATPAATFDPRLLDLGIHPGGGQLRNLAMRVGRQGAVALSLCGDTLDGISAERAGLVWRCLPDDELVPTARRLARRAAARPREAMLRAKDSLDRTIAVDDATAFAIELEQQQWSIDQPELIERVAALRERLARR
jgi:enoyl-CoA hydratase